MGGTKEVNELLIYYNLSSGRSGAFFSRCIHIDLKKKQCLILVQSKNPASKNQGFDSIMKRGAFRPSRFKRPVGLLVCLGVRVADLAIADQGGYDG